MKIKIFTKIKFYLSDLREKGLWLFLVDRIRKRFDDIICNLYKLIKFHKKFIFQGKSYSYFCHKYNHTWTNERAVEVPIVWDFILKNKSNNILEVGNVLSHYYHFAHDIVDKYEKDSAVINEDIVTYKPSKIYDLIVSISTIEHIGRDTRPRNATQVIKAIKNLQNILSTNGKLVITIALGYNPQLDKYIKKGLLKFNEIYCMKRLYKNNEWIEVPYKDVTNAQYNRPFPYANVVLIGLLSKNNKSS